MLIREGMVIQVRCPDLECSSKKEGGNQPPSQQQLVLIVGEELASRYDRLLMQQKYQADPQITFCPRLQCQEPVRKDPNYEKLCYCTHCGYAFCLLCEQHSFYYCRVDNNSLANSNIYYNIYYKVKRHGTDHKCIVSLKTLRKSSKNT